MKTYWDYTEKEKTELTKEELTQLIDIELMTKGVAKLQPPQLKEIQKPELTQEKWYEVDKVYFKTMDEATTYLSLHPYTASYDYSCGYNYMYAEAVGSCVKEVTLYTLQSILNNKTIMMSNKRAKDENETLSAEYKKQLTEYNKVVECIYSNLEICNGNKFLYETIYHTYLEYINLCEGNKDIALTFLQKQYSTEVIEKTRDWIGEQLI